MTYRRSNICPGNKGQKKVSVVGVWGEMRGKPGGGGREGEGGKEEAHHVHEAHGNAVQQGNLNLGAVHQPGVHTRHRAKQPQCNEQRSPKWPETLGLEEGHQCDTRCCRSCIVYTHIHTRGECCCAAAPPASGWVKNRTQRTQRLMCCEQHTRLHKLQACMQSIRLVLLSIPSHAGNARAALLFAKRPKGDGGWILEISADLRLHCPHAVSFWRCEGVVRPPSTSVMLM